MSTSTDEPGWHEVVRAAVRKVADNELRVEDGDFGVEWKGETSWLPLPERCVCPMGAVLYVHQPAPSGPSGGRGVVVAAASFLGVTEVEVDSFTTGFDGYQLEDLVRPDLAAYAFGRQMREEMGL